MNRNRKIVDPFNDIPSTVLLEIVKLVPDLTALSSLVQASPVVASLFDELAPEITEAVILSQDTPPQIQTLIRVIVLIECNSVSFSSDRNFFEKHIIDPASTSKICKSTPSHVLCRILAWASQIHYLAHCCIRDLNNHCLTPDPDTCHFLCPKRKRMDLLTGLQGQKFPPKDAGPPSWIEEQRVCLQLWRLQLLCCVVDIATATASSSYRKRPSCSPPRCDLSMLLDGTCSPAILRRPDTFWHYLSFDQIEALKYVYLRRPDIFWHYLSFDQMEALMSTIPSRQRRISPYGLVERKSPGRFVGNIGLGFANTGV